MLNTKNCRSSKDVVVLYSAGHLGSAILMNKLLCMAEVNIVGVVKTQPLQLTFRGRSRIKKQLKKLGWRFAWLLFWQRCIQGLGFLLTMVFPFSAERLKPAWKIAADHDIAVFHCENINDPDCQHFIAGLKPDLLISAYFSQILKKETIALPKMGVLNIHPGRLPTYRGAMAYFWVLKNGTQRGGVSVHWIDEGIDTGKVLAQRCFLLRPESTQQTVLMLSAVIGARLVRRILQKLIRGEELVPKDVNLREGNSYYPMPGEEDFNIYFRQRRFFRIRDILGLLVMKKHR